MRNNEFKMNFIANLKPSHIVISPGPGKPENAGISIEIVKKIGKNTPILGICLGHQAITVAFGGKLVPTNKIVHGKASIIYHDNSIIFSSNSIYSKPLAKVERV